MPIIKTGFFILIILIMGTGCEDDKRDPLCYKGKVISLNYGDGCYNIIEITETPTNYDEELSTGTTLTFNPESYRGKINIGDVVYFKIIQYEDWVGPAYANCLWPKYTARLEFCKK
ncbi:MAG TPA: hypothetical protein PK910_09410 [Bacteroidales bacterium]|nr:hypothetical protein [Bacteroidales bacterium]HRC90219.1 hypothetical protein [Bacteroidales bacterium]